MALVLAPIRLVLVLFGPLEFLWLLGLFVGFLGVLEEVFCLFGCEIDVLVGHADLTGTGPFFCVEYVLPMDPLLVLELGRVEPEDAQLFICLDPVDLARPADPVCLEGWVLFAVPGSCEVCSPRAGGTRLADCCPVLC